MQDLLKIGGEKFKVSAPDPYTVVINTLKPNAALLDALCQGGLSIMPKHMLEKPFQERNVRGCLQRQHAARSARHQRRVAPAPVRAGRERPCLAAIRITSAFDQNNQRLPYLDELVFLVVPDQDAADLKFRSGGARRPRRRQARELPLVRGEPEEGQLHAARPRRRRRARNFLWFNLNKVQPPLPGEKPPLARRVGEPFVDPVKYAWFSNPDFRRAVSMAIDRDAMIQSIFFGYGEKNWSQSTSGNKEWHSPDLVHYDYNPDEAKKLLAGLGLKDAQRRRRSRRHARQSGQLHAEDQQQQRACASAWRTSSGTIWPRSASG